MASISIYALYIRAIIDDFSSKQRWLAVNQPTQTKRSTDSGIPKVSSPKSCFIAIRESRIIGFCCYDATALGFCGPIGVEAASRGNGTGKALLLTSLLDMK